MARTMTSLGIGLCALALGPLGACGSPDPSPPHLVVVVVDTLRADALDASPVLERMAADGVAFERAYTHAPMTLPAHTSLFSSRLPHETGVVVNGQEVPGDLPLLAEHLAGQGYRTLGVASMASFWSDRPGEGLERGFERFVRVERDYADGRATAAALGELLDEELGATGDGGQALFLLAHLADPHEPYRDFLAGGDDVGLALDGNLHDRGDAAEAPHLRARAFLAAGRHEVLLERGGEAFVPRSLYVHGGEGAARRRIPVRWEQGERLALLDRVHASFDLDEPTWVDVEAWVTDRPSQARAAERYRLEAARAGGAVGEILADLDARGILEDAVVLFTSDHGEAFGEHGLNGHSHNLYDELLRVPTILDLPEGEAFGEQRTLLAERAGELVRHVDLAPTLLDLAGLAPLPGAVGSSLLEPGRARG